jgi:hypothetical protein
MADVFIWFAAVSVVVVAEVFASPMIDYRMVALGSLLPLVDLIIGAPTPLHTLAGPVVVLAAVMAATVGRRLVRRRLLGIPIGLFLHLVLDASWDDAELFWWPFFGLDLSPNAVPESSTVPVRLILEVLGLAVGAWAYRRYGLTHAENRDRLIRSGHLNRAYIRSS